MSCGLSQNNQHDSRNYPISENPEGCFLECNVAKAGKGDGQNGRAPKMKEVQGCENLVQGSGLIEFGSEESYWWAGATRVFGG
jgi:hypothetical protein